MMKFFIRIVIIVLLALALWNPSIDMGKGAVDFFVIIDDSKSMQNKLNSKVWSGVTQAISGLSKDSRVGIIRFAKHPVLELPLTEINSEDVQNILQASLAPENKPLDRSGSDLEKALVFVSSLIEQKRKSILLIINDGQQTYGRAEIPLQKISQQGHAIFQLDLSSLALADAWIESLDIPLQIGQNQLIPVSIVLGSNRNSTGNLSIFTNDKKVIHKKVQLNHHQLTAKHFIIPGCKTEQHCRVKVDLNVNEDSVAENNSRQAMTSINILKPVLYLYHSAQPPVLLKSLLVNNKVEAISTEFCISSALQLSDYRAIVLDDIAIHNLLANCWQAIDEAVRKQGLGLIVLGGRNSYSAGEYRHSLLESLLPVTVEAAEKNKATTLLFLIDKSGSMDTDNEGHSRIAMARQAIIDTLNSQNNKDNMGLISFDVEPHLDIPIKHYLQPGKEVEQKFNPKPAGGTRLKPALDFAINELEKTNIEKSIIILVTDGYLDELDLKQVTETLKDEKITLITLAIGQNEKTKGLKSITKQTSGSFLQVDNIAELPLLMRKEIDQRQTPVESGKIAVQQIQPFTFLPLLTTWPDIFAYNVTKEKHESFVYLRSNKGDPLWAMHYAGSGKVIALPSGLDDWAGAWLNWKQWNVLVNGVLESASTDISHPFLDISWDQKNGEYKPLQVDAITVKQAWLNDSSAWVTVLNPYQQLEQFLLPNVATGHYSLVLKTDVRGLYKMAVKIGEYHSSFVYFNEAIEESIPAPFNLSENTNYNMVEAIKEGGIVSAINQIKSPDRVRIRELFLAFILLLYGLLIVLEKYPTIRLVFESKKKIL